MDKAFWRAIIAADYAVLQRQSDPAHSPHQGGLGLTIARRISIWTLKRGALPPRSKLWGIRAKFE
jgi:hypothetical protein